MTKTTVCRCPACGSTEAYCDESRSIVDLSYMTCPACGNAGHNDSWEVAEDWLVDIDLPDGAPVPATLPGLADGEYFHQQLAKAREAREAREKHVDAGRAIAGPGLDHQGGDMTETKKRWIVMGFNSYARENYVVAEVETEAEAKRILALRQSEPNADHMWIANDES